MFIFGGIKKVLPCKKKISELTANLFFYNEKSRKLSLKYVHRRRIEIEDKAKVVVLDWGT